MKRKIRNIFIGVVFLTTPATIVFAQHEQSRYTLILGRDGFSSFDGKNYTSLEVYLNNNSNDTLYYRGSDCDNLLFSIKGNPYFRLDDKACYQSKFLKTALPPHRSQKMHLYLTMDKNPDRDIPLVINMKLYKWLGEDPKQYKYFPSVSLSDTTVMHYNSKHQIYYNREAFEILEKNERSILPDKDIYLLTENDLKLYTLTVDKDKISKPRDTIITNNDSIKVILVPVILHNNSDETLSFYSMTCSWYVFFAINKKEDIWLPGWDCDKNIPQIITVAPHKDFARNLTIIYNAGIKSGSSYRVSMSLLKAVPNKKYVWDFWPNEYVRFNKLWSNEIAIP